MQTCVCMIYTNILYVYIHMHMHIIYTYAYIHLFIYLSNQSINHLIINDFSKYDTMNITESSWRGLIPWHSMLDFTYFHSLDMFGWCWAIPPWHSDQPCQPCPASPAFSCVKHCPSAKSLQLSLARAKMRATSILGAAGDRDWIYHLVMTNIAMENPLQMVVLMGKSSINGPFSMAMLNNQRVMVIEW